MSRVDMALQNVDRDFFVLREDGSQVTQSTANVAIKSGLEMLDVQEGNRVLEIGTGSGFTGALLSYLVGSNGFVVSLDIEPDLTNRAKEMFKNQNITNVQFETRDGRDGFESETPYDRIVAWTTPEVFPAIWKRQIRENGVIVAPFRVLPIAGCTATVRFKNEYGVLKGEAVSEEGYIMMTSGPVTNFFGPEIHADLVGTGENPVWASSNWMKTQKRQDWCEMLFQSKVETSLFEDKGRDIRPYLLATNPDGFTYSFHPDYGYLIGYSSPDGFALVSNHHPQQWIVSDKIHADVLYSWFEKWKGLGKPSYDQLQPFIVNDQVKVRLKND